MSDRLEIVPLTKPPCLTVRVPGSKSITNRALVLAAQTVQIKVLDHLIVSPDTVFSGKDNCGFVDPSKLKAGGDGWPDGLSGTFVLPPQAGRRYTRKER